MYLPDDDAVVKAVKKLLSLLRPGGGIPESLANFVVTDAPYSLVQKIRELLN